MSPRARKTSSAAWTGAALLVLVALAAWFVWPSKAPQPQPSPAESRQPAVKPIEATADHVDAGNEDRVISVVGDVHAQEPLRDPQLGVSAGAGVIALMRRVEMRQWRERCAGTACNYVLVWSTRPIDSSRFREPGGHDNPARLPFSSDRFVATDVRLGAYRLDAMLVEKVLQASAPLAWPVRADQLPENLAATFRERDGVLYAGGDKPAAGDLRVSFRIVPASQQRLNAVQHGDRLAVAAGVD